MFEYTVKLQDGTLILRLRGEGNISNVMIRRVVEGRYSLEVNYSIGIDRLLSRLEFGRAYQKVYELLSSFEVGEFNIIKSNYKVSLEREDLTFQEVDKLLKEISDDSYVVFDVSVSAEFE